MRTHNLHRLARMSLSAVVACLFLARCAEHTPGLDHESSVLVALPEVDLPDGAEWEVLPDGHPLLAHASASEARSLVVRTAVDWPSDRIAVATDIGVTRRGIKVRAQLCGVPGQSLDREFFVDTGLRFAVCVDAQTAREAGIRIVHTKVKESYSDSRDPLYPIGEGIAESLVLGGVRFGPVGVVVTDARLGRRHVIGSELFETLSGFVLDWPGERLVFLPPGRSRPTPLSLSISEGSWHSSEWISWPVPPREPWEKLSRPRGMPIRVGDVVELALLDTWSTAPLMKGGAIPTDARRVQVWKIESDPIEVGEQAESVPVVIGPWTLERPTWLVDPGTTSPIVGLPILRRVPCWFDTASDQVHFWMRDNSSFREWMDRRLTTPAGRATGAKGVASE